MIDPRDWTISAALNGGDSTRMTAHDVARCRRILVRSDLPIARPVAFRRPRRERLACAAARCALTAYYALVLGLVIFGGSWLVRGLADAAARWVGGGQ